MSSVETAVFKYGASDILFNKAGPGGGEKFPDEDDGGWDRVIAVNLSGTFYMSRAVWPHMIEAGAARSWTIRRLRRLD